MRWVTWERVGIDRMGSAWLIRRYVDPDAIFSFVPRGTQPARELGEPFDIPGARFSHHRGRATFHSLLVAHHLKDPVLHRIARIIDEADTAQEAFVEPASVGLDYICRGIALTASNDDDALAQAFRVYDALAAYLASEEAPPADSDPP
jgi:hypothetical protein